MENKQKSDEIAKALREVFISPNVDDSNFESANMVDAIAGISNAILYAVKWLGNGDACTPMGAIETHGKAILDASEKISDSIRYLADAIREVGTQE